MPVLPDLPDVDLVLRRSARTRRFSLRVSRLDGRVTLSMPPRAREVEAMAFAQGHSAWLREVLADLSPPRIVAYSDAIPVEGRMLTLVPGRGRVQVKDDALIVPDPLGPRLVAWLRVLARDRLARACNTHAAAIGRRHARLTLRDTRSRWGSCTADGGLMFSWRLILAPPRILDYVAAHEVAHLAQMNHSPAFWAVVAGLCPEYAAHRAWLRGPDGQALQAWRFA